MYVSIAQNTSVTGQDFTVGKSTSQSLFMIDDYLLLSSDSGLNVGNM